MVTINNPNLSGLGLPQPLVDAIYSAFASISDLQRTGVVAGTPQAIRVIEDTRVNRDLLHPPAGVALGSLYVATDRNNVVYVCSTISHANAWVYLSGVYQRTQAQVAALVAELTANDTGMRIYVSDFAHLLWCTGATAVDWAPEDDHRAGEGPVFREIDPVPTTGWKLYDGSVVAYLKADGSTANVTLEDLVSTSAKAVYLKAGTPNSTANAAVGPTFTAGSISAAATGVAATTGGASSVQNITSTGVGSAPQSTHTHAVSISDPTHTHTAGAGAVGTNGEPRNLVRRPWFRQ